MAAYYNENDPFAAQWLRSLVREGLVAPGEVDERSVSDVSAADLAGFGQHHFFAGIGGWSHALRLASWPDDRPVWTGSCPCQPFSLAGRQDGFADARHLWPVWRDLIRQCRPATVFGEQVASAAAWLRLVRGDLEALGYAVGAIPLQAASAGAYHLRDRYWFVADADLARPITGPDGARDGDMDNTAGLSKREPDDEGDAVAGGGQARPVSGGAGSWVVGADGKARRVEPGIRLLAHGVPGRVGKLCGFGNAIDPRPAAAFIRAFAGG